MKALCLFRVCFWALLLNDKTTSCALVVTPRQVAERNKRIRQENCHLSDLSSLAKGDISPVIGSQCDDKIESLGICSRQRRRTFLANWVTPPLLASVMMGSTCLVFPAVTVKADDDDSAATTTLQPQSSSSSSRPRSPVESLLPAVRFARVLDQAKTIVDHAAASPEEDPSLALDALAALLLQPQNYTRVYSTVPDAPGRPYLEAYRQARQQLNPLFQTGAILVQKGEIRAWQRLKRQEVEAETRDEIRAALNAYTNQLNYRTDQYQFNASPALKSQMIRQDTLPDVKQVITSDLGLRYLYRNNVLDAMAEARAELQLLQSSESSSLDWSELQRLLSEAQGALDQWFSLIDPVDVRVAKEALSEHL